MNDDVALAWASSASDTSPASSSSSADLVDIITAFVGDTVRRGDVYDCSNERLYGQFLDDVVAHARDTHSLTATSRDVEAAVRTTPALRDHWMLQHQRYYSDERGGSTRGAAPARVSAAPGLGTRLVALLGFASAEDAAAEAARRESLERLRADERARCLRELDGALEVAVRERTYLATSSAEHGLYYVAVPLVYSLDACAAVEDAIAAAYSGRARQGKPALALWNLTRYNVTGQLRYHEPRVLLSMVFLRFIGLPPGIEPARVSVVVDKTT